ncbi:NAD(P)H-dependent oxidoreductase [Fluviicola sp.]|jgi:NAD(P)H-dependent FMN reductase|uniref:NADPH-dependent FMN reductase n=1 Tax=Fluviicola sp. TaxID=1917219 RepID=UPI0028339E75|nr:NAD(P)H-dependent oxidoreductase [Fluviicola sp.]MDR0802715.1 NAD(P)H-dependent oxidoreductase [Fluviicola sp.]
MKIVAFGASTSKFSINRQFAHFAARQFDAGVNLIDLNDFEMPLFSVDKEQKNGFPDEARKLLEIFEKADFLVISMAEHNGSYTAAFKNTLDWCSRIRGEVFHGKPMLLLSASPGKLGAKFVMESALSRFPKHTAQIIGHFSLPSFEENFKDGTIVNQELASEFGTLIENVKETLAKIK